VDPPWPSQILKSISYTQAQSLARRGTVIKPGGSIILANNMTLVLDLGYGVYLVLGKGAELEVLQHAGYRGGTRWRFFLRKGYAQIHPRIRKFSNPYSSLTMFTPAGVWEVRGTEASLEIYSEGDSTKAITVEGEVALSQVKDEVVPALRSNPEPVDYPVQARWISRESLLFSSSSDRAKASRVG